jgi:thymidine kinase
LLLIFSIITIKIKNEKLRPFSVKFLNGKLFSVENNCNEIVGSLEIITGPMMSGKSTELLRRLSIDHSIMKNVLYVNHISDVRSGNKGFSTHNLLYSPDIQNIFPPMRVSKLPVFTDVELKKYHTIAIDEAQFFDDLSEVVNYVEKLGKRVIISGLIGDYQRSIFGKLLYLFPFANKISLLTAKCESCAREDINHVSSASFTHRISNDTCQTVVGDKDKYISLCRKHYVCANKK